jgi:hypothetical protein
MERGVPFNVAEPRKEQHVEENHVKADCDDFSAAFVTDERKKAAEEGHRLANVEAKKHNEIRNNEQ